jgi:hypothetical protein
MGMTSSAFRVSSSQWGRLLERVARRTRWAVTRWSVSRYLRCDDGHPSPSPHRKWMTSG